MVVYKITNAINGKVYVGQTRVFGTRWKRHRRDSLACELPLYRAMRKYGLDAFHVDVIETMPEGSTQYQLDTRERHWMEYYDARNPERGYNLKEGGSRGLHAAESKAKMTASKLGHTVSAEARDKISQSLKKLCEDPAIRAANYARLKWTGPWNKGLRLAPLKIRPGHCKGEKWKEAHKDMFTAEVRGKMRAAKLGKKPANTKQVLCVETGQVFDGLTEAAKALGVQRQSIWLQIKGRLKRVGKKYTFRFL